MTGSKHVILTTIVYDKKYYKLEQSSYRKIDDITMRSNFTKYDNIIGHYITPEKIYIASLSELLNALIYHYEDSLIVSHYGSIIHKPSDQIMDVILSIYRLLYLARNKLPYTINDSILFLNNIIEYIKKQNI